MIMSCREQKGKKLIILHTYTYLSNIKISSCLDLEVPPSDPMPFFQIKVETV